MATLVPVALLTRLVQLAYRYLGMVSDAEVGTSMTEILWASFDAEDDAKPIVMIEEKYGN